MPVVGEIRAFAFDSSSPVWAKLQEDGWLHCDGALKLAAEYPGLFRALQYTWGGEPADNKFHLPDFRGMFLRGWHAGGAPHRADGRSGDTAGVGTRESSQPNASHKGTEGGQVGSFQPDALVRHDHYVDIRDTKDGDIDRSATICAGTQGGVTYRLSTKSEVGYTETRPCNFAVMYCIYAGVHL